MKSNKKQEQNDIGNSVGKVGQGIHVMASVEMQRQISELEGENSVRDAEVETGSNDS